MTEKNKLATAEPGRNEQVFARGRSSRSNPSGRFERHRTETFDDDWNHVDGDDECARVETTLTAENAKTILTRNDSPDIG
ncbi:MAG TPA: hypothetical protein VHV77_09890, partial [Pirellulales bacterium]|nr:hypothetical protein [Pirellulales bacterium]